MLCSFGALKVSCSAALLLFCFVALVFWCSAVVLSPLVSQGFLCPFVLYCCSALVFVFVLLQAVMDSAALVLCSSALMLFSCFHASLLPCFHCLFCIRRPSALPASRCFRSISLGSSVQSQVQRLYYVSQCYIATRTTTSIFFLQRWVYRLGFLITFLFLAARILVQICCENGTWHVTFFANVLLVSGTKNLSVPKQDLLGTFHHHEKYCLAQWPIPQ